MGKVHFLSILRSCRPSQDWILIIQPLVSVIFGTQSISETIAEARSRMKQIVTIERIEMMLSQKQIESDIKDLIVFETNHPLFLKLEDSDEDLKIINKYDNQNLYWKCQH